MNGNSKVSVEKNQMDAVHRYILETGRFKIEVCLFTSKYCPTQHHTQATYIYILSFVNCLLKENMFKPNNFFSITTQDWQFDNQHLYLKYFTHTPQYVTLTRLNTWKHRNVH